MTTMSEMYGDKSDSNHEACDKCGMCIHCGDCKCNGDIRDEYFKSAQIHLNEKVAEALDQAIDQILDGLSELEKGN